jgi:hypothetical protein
MKRWGPLVIAVVATIVIGAGSGVAYAYFTSSGAGTGSTSTGSMQALTFAIAGTPSASLLPGGPAGDVTLKVVNPNNFAVSLTAVVLQSGGAITFDSGHSGCTTTNSNPLVTLNVPSGDLPINIPVPIPANSAQSIDLANAVTMDVSATSNCQGATIYIPVTITVKK